MTHGTGRRQSTIVVMPGVGGLVPVIRTTTTTSMLPILSEQLGLLHLNYLPVRTSLSVLYLPPLGGRDFF